MDFFFFFFKFVSILGLYFEISKKTNAINKKKKRKRRRAKYEDEGKLISFKRGGYGYKEIYLDQIEDGIPKGFGEYNIIMLKLLHYGKY